MAQHKDTTETAFIPGKRVLFVAAGGLAAEAVQGLGRIAQQLQLRVSGPFGFIKAADLQADETNDESEQQVGSIVSKVVISQRLPWDQQPSENPLQLKDAGIEHQIRSVVRRLMSIGDALPPETPHRRSLRVYVVIDLRCIEETNMVLSALRSMRREEITFDITGVLLTGRSADYQPDEERWREGRELVESATIEESLLNRLYFMDGKNADQYWLRSEDDHADMASAFIFHHGLSPVSHQLRTYEASRISGNQPLDEVTGTFCARTLTSDREFVIRMTTKQLYDQLFSKEQEEIPTKADNRAIADVVRDLKSRLTKLFEESSPAGSLAGPDSSQEAVRKAVRGELESAIRKLCKENPLSRLPSFFDSFLDQIALMKLRGAVRKERALRHEVAEKVRDAHKVIPVKEDVETPRRNWMLYGGLACFAVAGLVMLGGLIWYPDLRGLPLVFALLLSGACLLELSPEWKRFFRCNDEESESAEKQSYLRKLTRAERATGILLCIAGGLLVMGAIDIVPAWIPTLFNSQLASVIAAALILIGALVPCFWASRDWEPCYGSKKSPENVAGERRSDLHAIGGVIMICLLVALTWAWPISLRNEIAAFILAFVGVSFVAGGMLMLSWPRKAYAVFSAKLKTSVNTFVSIPQQSVLNATSNRLLAKLEAWCHDARAPDQEEEQDPLLNWPSARGFGSILDAVRQDWPKRLAELCQQQQRAAVSNNELWIDCLMETFDRQTGHVGNYKLALAHHVASSWMKNRSWEDLVTLLGKSNTDWFTYYFESSLVPMWPDNVRQWDQDVGVAAVSDGLFDLIQPDSQRNVPYHVKPVPWPDSGMVVLVRRVQGIPGGLFGDGYVAEQSAEPQPGGESVSL